MKLNEETLGAGYYFAAISNRLDPGMSSRASKLPMSATLRRILSLAARIWHADSAGDDLPLLHRLAVIYLMVPLIIWLGTWFHWWFGIPAAVVIILAIRPALSGPLGLSLPRPLTLAVLLVAAGWVMSTAAGGVLDTNNGDWYKHRSILLNLSYYPWPTFIPDPLAAYSSPELHSPSLLRYYLGWYIVPGLFARLLGTAALNWAVPLWTWLGIALILLLFVRERRGWAVILALVVFVFFSGMDSLRSVIVEAVHGLGEFIGFRIELKSLWTVETLYKSNTDHLMWAPQHFVPAGLYTILLLQLRRQARFLGVSAILLAAAPLWSPFVAVGLLPFVGALLWTHGFRPFLARSNLLLAVAMVGLIAVYLTSGPLESQQGWIWERYEWPELARWIPIFYLTEFLLLAILLCALRPNLLRKPFFAAAVTTLILLPVYTFGEWNDLTMRGSLPSILVLCYYCTATLSDQADALLGGATSLWKRLGFAGIAATLAVGSLTVIPNFERAFANVGPFRYDQVDYAITLDVPVRKLDQYVVIARDIPNVLGLLLDTNALSPGEEGGELVLRFYMGPGTPPDVRVLNADTLATLAAARSIVGTGQESIFVAAGDYDRRWMRFIFWNRPEVKHLRPFDYERSIIFPVDKTDARYLFAFEPPDGSILDRYFDEGLVQTIGTLPSGRPITLHRLVDPIPPFEPEWPVPVRFGDQLFVYGFDLPKDVRAGDVLTVRWYWRLLAVTQGELAFSNQLFGDDDRRHGQLDDRGFAPGYWPIGTSGISTFKIDIDADAPTGAYWLRVAMYRMYARRGQSIPNLPVFDANGNPAGNHLRLGPIKIHGTPATPSPEVEVSDLPAPNNLLSATFADQIDLLGYSLSDHRLVPGGSLDLTLFWSPRGRPTQDYTVFVHLLDSDGQLRGQADSPPRFGKYPTSVWDAGELITDLHTLSLAPDLQAGGYRLAIGLYHQETGQRIPMIDEDGQISGDYVTISGLVVEDE